MMKRDEIVTGLRRLKVETGSIACLGCGWENSCGIRGCRIMREAADMLENDATHFAALERSVAIADAASGLRQDAIEKWKKAYGTLRAKHSDLLEQNGKRDWIPVGERMPEDDGDVLAIVSGYPTPNITLEDVMVVAAFCGGEGWYIGEYPDWDAPIVTHWMPLPEPPREVEA